MTEVLSAEERLNQLIVFKRQNEEARAARIAKEQRKKAERQAEEDAAKRDHWTRLEAEYTTRFLDAGIESSKARQWAREKVEREQYAIADIDPDNAARASLLSLGFYGNVEPSHRSSSTTSTSVRPAPASQVGRTVEDVVAELRTQVLYGANQSSTVKADDASSDDVPLSLGDELRALYGVSSPE